MNKVFQYSFLDLLRSRWTLIYFLFFALANGGLLYLNGGNVKVVISLMNVVILLVPLVSMIYGLMYMYQVRDYVEVMLAQPISRRSIFSGYFMGLSLSLSLSAMLGLLLPLLILFPGQLSQPAWWVLVLVAVLLTVIFAGLACLLVLKHDNRLRGFGLGLLVWLVLAVLYDGVFLVMLMAFQEYPLEKIALSLTLLNPIDMGRILLIFQMDYSAMMGYTGAVFEKFLGTMWGSVIISISFMAWIVTPVLLMLRRAAHKDF